MKTTLKIALTTILSGSVAVISSTTLASGSGLPSSTNWQAWNDYVSKPAQSKRTGVASGLPSSTNWQTWNRYLSTPNQTLATAVQAAIPSSTNWKDWNMYVANN